MQPRGPKGTRTHRKGTSIHSQFRIHTHTHTHTHTYIHAYIQAIGSHWDCMENRHIRGMLRGVLSPFICKCPQRLHSVLLQPLLPPLLVKVRGKLSVGYAGMLAGVRGTHNAQTQEMFGGDKDEVCCLSVCLSVCLTD